MKAMKRTLAALLCLAMVLTGICWVQMDGSEAKAEAETTSVNKDMLDVKVQVATDDSYVMRFVSSVDSLNYKATGFEVTPEGGTMKTYSTDTVYERIVSKDAGVAYKFSPKVVDTSSEYFVTAKLQATAGVNYTVRAFVVTLDGDTVYGQGRLVNTDDAYTETYVSMSFEATTVPTTETIAVTYGADETETTAKVMGNDGNTVYVRVQNVASADLPSATKFTFGTYGSAIYRNLYTKYEGTGTDDQTWYDVYLADDSTETEFTIATNADLYGFMNLMADKKTFAGKTLYVISDIAMNDNVTDTVVESWADGTVEAPYKWNSTGTTSTSTQFTGTFDGQMHTISGVYMSETGTRVGLFGVTAKESTVKNFYLTDSYFTTTGGDGYAHLGSVAGECWGTIDTVYSDAIVKSSSMRTGGIVGVLNTVAAAETAGIEATMNNCWFDGEVRMSTDTGVYAGGIIGYVMQKRVNLTNALFTGKITYEAAGDSTNVAVGGIVGGNNNYPSVKMEDCVSVGSIVGSGTTGVGSVLGYGSVTDASKYTTTYNLVDVYGATETHSALNGGYAESGVTITGPGLSVAKANISGINGYTNTLLDFEDVWVAITDETPVLKSFDEKYTATTVVDLTDAEQNNWFNTSVKIYSINTVSAFKALSSYTNGTTKFQGYTIYLGKDIDLNPEWTAPTDTKTAVTGEPEEWRPIGSYAEDSDYEFRGTFDGREHTISGLYMNTSTQYAALFGRINKNATLKNFAIKNSYIKYTGTGAWAASVVGFCYGGKISNVYSDATIISAGTQMGGIAGRAEGTLDKCWFDGNVYATKISAATIMMGGIAGCSWSKTHTKTAVLLTTTIKNCLNTGKLSYNVAGEASDTEAGIGGILGRDNGYCELTMSNCVSIGEIDTNQVVGTGAVIGMFSSGTTFYGESTKTYSKATITNCYGAKDCIEGLADRQVIQLTSTDTDDNITQTGCASLTTAELQGSQVYNNTNITLDYTSWIARSNGSPIPKVFVDWIVPASATVEKPAAAE